ncbi:hypothetical protein V8F33_002143 [Rhypophila sp. PSN 637]
MLYACVCMWVVDVYCSGPFAYLSMYIPTSDMEICLFKNGYRFRHVYLHPLYHHLRRRCCGNHVLHCYHRPVQLAIHTLPVNISAVYLFFLSLSRVGCWMEEEKLQKWGLSSCRRCWFGSYSTAHLPSMKLHAPLRSFRGQEQMDISGILSSNGKVEQEDMQVLKSSATGVAMDNIMGALSSLSTSTGTVHCLDSKMGIRKTCRLIVDVRLNSSRISPSFTCRGIVPCMEPNEHLLNIVCMVG